MRTLAERFFAKVRKTAGCWEWTASRHHQWQYGHFSVDRASKAAHRVSWELHYGPIPDGMKVCHHCDNPPCVRPDHLFLGTDADNKRDSIRKGRARDGVSNRKKTHCPQGHEYTPENTRIRHDPRGWTMRFCRECQRRECGRQYAKNRERRIAQAIADKARRRAADPERVKQIGRDATRRYRERKRAELSHLASPALT